MYYKPPFLIEINWQYVKNSYAWKRQAIALFIHELVHVYQYFVICRCNVKVWNDNINDAAEILPDKIQDLALRLLGCNYLLV